MLGTKGQTIRVFLVDGNPSGMLIAEVIHQAARVWKIPRAQVPDSLKYMEQASAYSGVYLLLGEKDGGPRAYIGEADNVGDRVRFHLQNIAMDWCDTIVLITAAENALTKSHVRYLESRLIKRAQDVGRIALQNATSPPIPALGGKAEEATTEAFLETTLLLLRTIGIDAFLDDTRQKPPSDAPLFELLRPEFEIRATASSVHGEFVVHAGSCARAEWTSNAKNQTYSDLHAELVSRGILQQKGQHLVFGKNCAFKSPSAAASVVNGFTSNGSWWKVRGQQQTTYYQWERERLAGDNLTKR